MSIIPKVISQHAEEVAFLWPQRDQALHDPHYGPSDMINLDDRLEAHINGLRIAGNEGWELCEEELIKWKETGEVFTAALLAFESGIDERIQTLTS